MKKSLKKLTAILILCSCTGFIGQTEQPEQKRRLALGGVAQAQNLSYENRSLQIAEPYILRSPFAGRIVKISPEGELFTSPPEFPPGLFFSARSLNNPLDPNDILDIDFNFHASEQLRYKLDLNSPIIVTSSEFVDQYSKEFRKNAFESLASISFFKQKTFSDNYPIWKHYELHNPNYANLLKVAYEELMPFRVAGGPVSDRLLLELFSAANTVPRDSSEEQQLTEDVNRLVESAQNDTEKDHSLYMILRALSEAALWQQSQTGLFRDNFFIRTRSSSFDFWPPNSTDLLRKDPATGEFRINFTVPRVGAGVERGLANIRQWTPRTALNTLPRDDDNLVKFASYWEYRATSRLFSLQDRVFLEMFLKNIASEKIASYSNPSYGNVESFIELVAQVRSSEQQAEMDFEFPINENMGLLRDVPLNLDGYSYVATALAAEARSANEEMKKRYTLSALVACTYGQCRRPSTELPLNLEIMNANLQRLPDGLKLDVSPYINITARHATTLGWIKSAYPSAYTDRQLAVLLDLVRDNVRYSAGRFVRASERSSGLVYAPGDDSVNRFDDYFELSNGVGAIFTNVAASDINDLVEEFSPSFSDDWGVFRRMAGVALQFAGPIRSSTEVPSLTQNPVTLFAAVQSLYDQEIAMNAQLSMEARAIRELIYSERDATEAKVTSRQDGRFFFHDDGVVFDHQANKQGDWVEVGAKLMSYIPSFEYRILVSRSNNKFPNLKGSRFNVTLECSGRVLFANETEKAVYAAFFEKRPDVEEAAEQLRVAKIDAVVELREPANGTPNLERLWEAVIEVRPEDRFVAFPGLEPDDRSATVRFQNHQVFTNKGLRLFHSLTRQSIKCSLEEQVEQ